MTAPRVAGETPYKLQIQADVIMPSAIREVSSPTHPIAVRNEHANRALVSLGQKEVLRCHFHSQHSTRLLCRSQVSLDKDLVILIEQAEPYATRAVIEHDPVHNSNALQVTFCPQPVDLADAVDLRCEFIFLVCVASRRGFANFSSLRFVLCS